MVQELHAAGETSAKTRHPCSLGETNMPMPTKTWKTLPAYFTLMELLKKKGALADTELYEALTDEFEDLGYKDFSELLMRLEISGKIRVTSMSRGKRRVELLT
jgi:hypothetical protein